MSVFTLRMDGTMGIFDSITKSLADAFDDNTEEEITTPEIASLPLAQRKKVMRLRRQLIRDTYDIDDRLDAVLENLLMDIT